jgi:ribosomal protein S14
VSTHQRQCVLCGRPPAHQGIFLPNARRQADVNAPAGKTRAIGYTLCRRCHRQPDSRHKVEQLIFADFARARAATNN